MQSQPEQTTYNKRKIRNISAIAVIILLVLNWRQLLSSYYVWRGNNLIYESSAKLATFDRAIQINPNNPNPYISRGQVHLKTGYYNEAFVDFNHAVELDGENGTAYRLRGIAYASLGNISEALHDYDTAIQLDPQEPLLYLYQAGAFAAIGEREKAIAGYEEFLRRYKRQDNNTEAAYKQIDILSDDRESAVYYTGLGFIHRRDGNLDLALNNLTLAIDLNPNYARAYNIRGQTNLDLGNLDDAIADFSRAVQLGSDDPEVFIGRARASDMKGDYYEALADFRHAIAITPDESEAYIGRAMVYEHMGNPEAAIKDYQDFIDRHHDSDGLIPFALDRIESLTEDLP